MLLIQMVIISPIIVIRDQVSADSLAYYTILNAFPVPACVTAIMTFLSYYMVYRVSGAMKESNRFREASTSSGSAASKSGQGKLIMRLGAVISIALTLKLILAFANITGTSLIMKRHFQCAGNVGELGIFVCLDNLSQALSFVDLFKTAYWGFAEHLAVIVIVALNDSNS